MAFVVKSRSTGALVGRTVDVEEALLFDGQYRVDGDSYDSILELAAARVEAMPDHNSLPSKEESWVRYTSKAGRLMICQVVRLTHPDAEGYPQLAELVNPQRPDGSFVVSTSGLKPIDLSTMTPELANALIQGETYEENGGGNHAKLRHGLRRS